MDMMAIRRRVLMASRKVIDTSPKILQHGVRYLENGSTLSKANTCITVIYDLDVTINSSSNRLGTTYGVVPSIINYIDGAYDDYWNLYSNTKPISTKFFAYGSNQVSFTLQEDMLDVCYAIHNATGQILFAGKNSPYYGYTNVNDMP